MPKTKTIVELRSELLAKQKQLSKLRKQRKGLAADLGALDKKISSLTGGPAAKPRKKAAKKKATRRKAAKKAVKKPAKKARRRKVVKAGRPKVVKQKPLVAYLAEAIRKAKGKVQAKDLAAAVLKAGYATKDKSFKATVAKTLAKNKQFKRVGRGLYVLAA